GSQGTVRAESASKVSHVVGELAVVNRCVAGMANGADQVPSVVTEDAVSELQYATTEDCAGRRPETLVHEETVIDPKRAVALYSSAAELASREHAVAPNHGTTLVLDGWSEAVGERISPYF